MQTHIIYIPGLGDRYDGFRVAALKAWRLWGVTTQHVPIKWFDGASMTAKQQLIIRAIERAPANSRVVLIGESAGATLALQYVDHPRVSRVITLCGVARSTTPVSSYLRNRAPALHQAVGMLPDSYGADIHCVRAVIDGVVAKKYSVIDGATVHVIWFVGHITTIALCLTALAPVMAAIAKKQK